MLSTTSAPDHHVEERLVVDPQQLGVGGPDDVGVAGLIVDEGDLADQFGTAEPCHRPPIDAHSDFAARDHPGGVCILVALADQSLSGGQLNRHTRSRQILEHVCRQPLEPRNLLQRLDRRLGNHRPRKFLVWSRTADHAQRLAAPFPNTQAVTDLASAVSSADVVSCATMATEPIIRGEWLRAGQHLDLIGAYRSDMREADDTALVRSRLFVDSRDTTLDHIGELSEPISRGVITRESVVADFYDITQGIFSRGSNDEITVFKNGGGAHLDLMAARYILDRWREAGRT